MTKRKIKPFKIDDDYNNGYYTEFGIIRDTNRTKSLIDWFSCRDEFAECQYLGRFLYYCVSGSASNTKAFIKKIESILKLPKDKRIKFRKTNNKDIIYLSLSDFWKTIVHRSLLTILLRAGQKYNKKTDNWSNIIANDEYLKNTKSAIKRFLDGHTRPILQYASDYDEYFHGWVDEFRYDNDVTIKSKLRRNA